MMRNLINIQIVITAVLLFGIILFFQITEYDIFFQNFFYNFDTSSWVLNRDEPVLKFLLYDGLKKLLITCAVLILFMLIFLRNNKIIKEYKKGLIIVLLATIIVPSTVVSLKNTTNTPCPKNIEHFGGNYPNIKVFDSYPKDFVQKKKIRCWPAGHASIGFAFLSLFFLFKDRKNRLFALLFALTLGWSMGVYKMLIGDHFLSHTLITMLIAWLEILIILKGVFIFESLKKE